MLVGDDFGLASLSGVVTADEVASGVRYEVVSLNELIGELWLLSWALVICTGSSSITIFVLQVGHERPSVRAAVNKKKNGMELFILMSPSENIWLIAISKHRKYLAISKHRKYLLNKYIINSILRQWKLKVKHTKAHSIDDNFLYICINKEKRSIGNIEIHDKYKYLSLLKNMIHLKPWINTLKHLLSLKDNPQNQFKYKYICYRTHLS